MLKDQFGGESQFLIVSLLIGRNKMLRERIVESGFQRVPEGSNLNQNMEDEVEKGMGLKMDFRGKYKKSAS